ncbi:TraR/DksA family transcriptional regulator [Kosakonia sp. YIM B13611]|uniref:TraR/DksA family transcriptional regulator n=1 Tax=unclassified Kosakonia TaxID=2632876 RepID=UPI003699C2CD
MAAEIIDQANELVEQNISQAIQRMRIDHSAVSAKYCSECGEDIPAPRRAAVPGCQMCASCQADLELIRKQKGM